MSTFVKDVYPRAKMICDKCRLTGFKRLVVKIGTLLGIEKAKIAISLIEKIEEKNMELIKGYSYKDILNTIENSCKTNGYNTSTVDRINSGDQYKKINSK